MKISVKPGVGTGCYRVLADGEEVGEVRKRIQRYNLRRTVTSITWDLWLHGEKQTGYFNTRKQALDHAEHVLKELASALNWEGESECGPYEWEDGLSRGISGMILVCSQHRDRVAYPDAYMTSVKPEDLRYPCMARVDPDDESIDTWT